MARLDDVHRRGRYGGWLDSPDFSSLISFIQTFVTIYAFSLAMTLYPEIARRVQAEIDQVIGDSRLPALTDRPSLPYTQATILEAMRWHAVVPYGWKSHFLAF